MDIKKDILWRVYLCFIALVVMGFMVMGKVAQLQLVDGTKWRAMGDSLYRTTEKRPAERGTIYSDNNEMLSSSIPFFDVHIDFRADGLRAKNGKLFYENIDSLSYYISNLLQDKSKKEYKQMLTQAYKNKEPYFELKKHLSYQQYYQLRNFPLVKLGKFKSGFLEEVTDERLNPFGLLANRTIGLSRDGIHNVGLEQYYDSILKGQSGERAVQFIAGGARVPINGSEIEPVNGNDIKTTINVHIQDIAQNALLKMMQQNQALTGTAIVMEVATGQVKAIANLGVQPNGNYYEDNNYALVPSEPGSTIKIVGLLAALEDGIITINSTVDINGGVWVYGDRRIEDAERSPRNTLTYKEAIEHSSNVAMAKLTALNYNKQPKEYLKYYGILKLNSKSGIDLTDPYIPYIKNPKQPSWSNQTLASMGFGYELRISPLQTLMVYNAIANNGVLMKPYLVTDVLLNGTTIQHIQPTVLNAKVCSKQTVLQLQECLTAVCTGGTAKEVFDSTTYQVAGKTGTAHVSDGTYTYNDGVYQSSFVGYFPADKPRYSCIVVIKNKPKALQYFGGKVAAPVFKEIADRLMTISTNAFNANNKKLSKDLTNTKYKALTNNITTINKALYIPQNNTNQAYTSITYSNTNAVLTPITISVKLIPNVIGFGAKDAIYALEQVGVQVKLLGKGKVTIQSIPPGVPVIKNNIISITLN